MKNNFYVKLLETAFTAERERKPVRLFMLTLDNWFRLCKSVPEGILTICTTKKELENYNLGYLSIRCREDIPIILSPTGNNYVGDMLIPDWC